MHPKRLSEFAFIRIVQRQKIDKTKDLLIKTKQLKICMSNQTLNNSRIHLISTFPDIIENKVS